jgi:hypothetical protein
MSIEPLPLDLDARWQASKRELGRIATMPGLDREIHASEAERLKPSKTASSGSLGYDHQKAAESRRWLAWRDPPLE